MLTDVQANRARDSLRDSSQSQNILQGAHALFHERKWRQFDADVETESIAASRWQHSQAPSQHEAIAPPNRYFIGVALIATRVKLTKGRQTIFDGVMPAGTLYVSGPSQQLGAQFQAPCDFLHLHVSASCFPWPSTQRLLTTDSLKDLMRVRDPFAEQLARVLTKPGNVTDRRFVRCASELLVMHLARSEQPRARISALPKWRLRRVEEYINTHLDRRISLADLANVAGLSRMHFAAQFRIATGYRPREYLVNQRIEHAKQLMSTTELSLAEVALTAGFSSQAHFTTIFKRATGETPARWRCANKDEPIMAKSPSTDLASAQVLV